MSEKNSAFMSSFFTCVIVCVILVGSNSFAQELDYIKTDTSLLERWDSNQIAPLKKKELRSLFEKKLNIRLERKPYGYEDTAWKDHGIELWEKLLPEEVAFKIPFSDRSRWLLTGLFVENLPIYTKLVPLPQVEGDLKVSLFCLVGIAQPEALKANQKSITLAFLFRALDVWKCSQIWPKCKSKNHNKKKEK